MSGAPGSGEGGARREPTPISDLLGAVLEEVAAGVDLRLARLVRAWPEVAGDRWSEVATPVGIREGTLLVEVATGADATVLRYDGPRLISRITERFGEDLVTAVRFRVVPPKGTHKSSDSKGFQPMSGYTDRTTDTAPPVVDGRSEGAP